jgi:hypothetical protein
MLQQHDVTPVIASIAELLTQKQHLLSRLEEYRGSNERAEIRASSPED